MGTGWGGPARGAGSGGHACPFTAATPTRRTLAGGRPDPLKVAQRLPAKAAAQHRSDQLEEELWRLAFTADCQDTQVTAVERLLDILEGRPASRCPDPNLEFG